jgi:phage gp36-like protein
MYATISDLRILVSEAELLQLTDDARTGDVDEAKVTEALEAASRTIDSYVAVRYGLPLASVPEVLNTYCKAIARYNLHARKPTMPEPVQRGYDNAMRELRDISAGKAVLSIAGKEAPAAENTILMETSPRLFSRDSLRGF